MLSTPAFTVSKKVMDITKDMVVGDKEEKTEDYVWIQDIPTEVELRFWEPVNREHKEETGAKKWAKLRTAIKGKHVDTLVGELRDGVLKAGASDNAEVEIPPRARQGGQSTAY